MNDIAVCPADSVYPSRRRWSGVMPVAGPAGADRTASAAAVVAPGNYWTPGPWRGRTVPLVGMRIGRRGEAERGPT